MIAVRLLAVLALVALNGFFAAAEFSLVAVRLSRVRQLVARRNARARIVLELLNELHRIVSGVQVGITLTSLALGAVGELTLARIFSDLLPEAAAGTRGAIIVHGAALTLAFLLLTVFHVVLGELVPKSISLSRAERIALMIARPFHWYLHSFRWVIDLLDGASRRVVHAMGIAAPMYHSVAHSAEELQVEIQQARERGLLAPGQERFILSALELGQVQVREIMVPRPDMHTISSEASLEDVMRVFATTQRSRLPVFRLADDHVLGFIHVKDMIWVLLDRERRLEEGLAPQEFDLRHVLRDALIVPETKPASDLLRELRTRRIGLAIVVDEHGSILGMVTLEDILEQLVGEIYDEFDVVERPLTLADGAMIFDASLNIRDLETQYNIALPDDPAYSTVGGFILAQLGFIPRGGETFEYGGYCFTVVEMDARRVARVKIQQLRLPEGQTGAVPASDVRVDVESETQASVQPAERPDEASGGPTRTAHRTG